MGHPFLSSFAFFCFIHSVAIIATIQPTSHVPPSLGLTLLPICPVGCYHSNHPHPVGSYRFGNYLSPPVVLTDWLPSISTPSAYWSLSMPFQFRHPASPVLQYVSLLTGIALCTSLGVCGRCGIRTRCSSQAFRGITLRCAPTCPLIPTLPVCTNYPGFYLPCLVANPSPP